MARHPRFQSRAAAVTVGLAFFAAGWYCLYDAWEGRGGQTPAILRPFTWW